MVAAAEIATFLKGVRLFREFSANELLAFAARLDERNLKEGQVLFREGDRIAFLKKLEQFLRTNLGPSPVN